MEADSGNSRVPFAEENTPPTLVNKVWCITRCILTVSVGWLNNAFTMKNESTLKLIL